MTTAAPGTILAEMKMDIYASKKGTGIWIVHDKKLGDLDHLLYTPPEARLEFVFEDGSVRDLGAVIKESLRPHLEDLDKAVLIRNKGLVPVNFAVVDIKRK